MATTSNSENLEFITKYYQRIYRAMTSGTGRSKNEKAKKRYRQKLKQRMRTQIADKRYEPKTLEASKDAHKRMALLANGVNVYGSSYDKSMLFEQIRNLAKADYDIFQKACPDFDGSLQLIILGDPKADKLLRKIPLLEYYRKYYTIRVISGDISKLMPVSPHLQYPEARNYQRKFYLHVGPTNSGKTYDAINRLKTANHGVYLGPLRLLALEIYDKMLHEGVPCSMITGEERLCTPSARVISSTIEMLDLEDKYDIAVIDEAQMLKDHDRGHKWTRAILGTCAKEVHVCMAPEAEDLVKRLVKLCDDTFEVIRHERNTELVFEPELFSFDETKTADAMIVFSKKSVLKLSAYLESRGVHCSVIYGKLPPAARREQINKFLSKETQVIVSTDAIGMGVNLPIRRIVFAETEKFDGKHQRPLRGEEIRQIAGRAGRFGMYETGYVKTVKDAELIEEALEEKPVKLNYAISGFAEILLDIPADIPSILTAWKKMPHTPLFKVMPVETLLVRYHMLEKALALKSKGKTLDQYDKHQVYDLITCPFDENEREVAFLWTDYALAILNGNLRELNFPQLSSWEGLADLEVHYKCLDLYYQLSCRFGLKVEEQGLAAEKNFTVEEINRMLMKM